MNEPKKNPYRELANILRALPPERRLLLSKRFNGVLRDEPQTRCGCAFGMAYPNAPELVGYHDVNNIYWFGREGSYRCPEAERPAFRKFADWADSIGATAGFLHRVAGFNDDAGSDRNTRADAERRYAEVLHYLDTLAESIEQLRAQETT